MRPPHANHELAGIIGRRFVDHELRCGRSTSCKHCQWAGTASARVKRHRSSSIASAPNLLRCGPRPKPPNFGRRVWRSASSEMNKFTDLDSYSIEEFCRRHSISVAMYYKLRQQKLTPREMRLGVRVLISREAAARWRSEREAASGS